MPFLKLEDKEEDEKEKEKRDKENAEKEKEKIAKTKQSKVLADGTYATQVTLLCLARIWTMSSPSLFVGSIRNYRVLTQKQPE